MSAIINTWRAHVLRQPKLVLALVLAVGLTIATTVASIIIYYAGGFYKFDLSRPGFEKERALVTNDNNESQKNYDTTSPVTPEALNVFIKDFDTSTQKVSVYGDFRDQSLSDAELQLPPSQ